MWSDVDIKVKSGDVGGIFGKVYLGDSSNSPEVFRCANLGDVSTNEGCAGGVAGGYGCALHYSRCSVEIAYCANAGCVSSNGATAYAGGITRYNRDDYDNEVIVYDCFNVGDVFAASTSSSAYAAGVAVSQQGRASRLYNVGAVSASTEIDRLSKVVFPVWSDGAWWESAAGCGCYYLDSIPLVGEEGGYGGCNSLSDEQMRQQESFEGFDFENTWRMDTGGYGYPVLQWMTDYLIEKLPNTGEPSGPSEPQQTTVTVFFSSELDVDEADAETGEKWVNRNVQVLWGDSLFAQPANAGYNHGLARLGAALSCMTYAEGRYVNTADDHVLTAVEGGMTQKVTYAAGVDPVADGSYAYKTLWGGSEGEGMGFAFDDIENHYYRDSQRIEDNDTCAYTLAVKEVERDGVKVPLVMVLVRGTAANAEWISNANLADVSKAFEDYHEGFQLASAEVLTGVRDFLSARGYDANDALFFVTGHSRGAAVANLVAAGLSNWQGGTGRVYAYTFAAPNCVSEDEVEGAQYGNIFNIANPDDIVTMIPLTDWGYATYGKTLYLQSKTNTAGYLQSDELAGMSAWFEELTSGVEYVPNPEGALGPSMLAESVRGLCWDVEEFYKPSFVFVAEHQGSSYLKRASLGDVVDSLMRYLYVGDACTTEDVNLLVLAAAKEVLSLVDIMKGLASLSGAAEMAMLAALGVSVVATVPYAAHAHTSETYLAWMMEMGSGAGYKDCYKRVRIKCPVDVYVYDASGALVAKIEDDAVDESILASGLPAYVDEDGAKYLDVPADGEYSVKIVATDEGEMDYTVSECDGGGNVQHCAAFLDIPLAEGQEFEGNLPEGEVERAAEYELTTSDGRGGEYSVPLTGDYSGDEIGSIDIRVSTRGDGNAWGNAQVEPGRSVTVRAEAVGGSVFEGWYEGDELASADAEYSFAAERSRSLVAVFGQPTSGDGADDGGVPDGGDGSGTGVGGDGDGSGETGGDGGSSDGDSGAGGAGDGSSSDSSQGTNGNELAPDKGSASGESASCVGAVAATGDAGGIWLAGLGALAALAVAGMAVGVRRRSR